MLCNMQQHQILRFNRAKQLEARCFKVTSKTEAKLMILAHKLQIIIFFQPFFIQLTQYPPSFLRTPEPSRPLAIFAKPDLFSFWVEFILCR